MKRIACFAIAIVWLTLTPAGARDNYSRLSSVDALHYRIQLELKDTGGEINGETEILVAFNEDNVKNIPLDFNDLIIDEVGENDRLTMFAVAEDKFLVQLAGAYHRGDQCRIRIKYHGAPKDGLFIKANKFGDRSAVARMSDG